MSKPRSQRVFVPSVAIFQYDPMAVFVVSDRRSLGTGYWIPLRQVQGLYGALTYGVQSDFVLEAAISPLEATMEAISVKCPVCRAGRGRPCRDHSSRAAMSDFHPARASRVEEVGSSHDDPDSFGKIVELAFPR